MTRPRPARRVRTQARQAIAVSELSSKLAAFRKDRGVETQGLAVTHSVRIDLPERTREGPRGPGRTREDPRVGPDRHPGGCRGEPLQPGGRLRAELGRHPDWQGGDQQAALRGGDGRDAVPARQGDAPAPRRPQGDQEGGARPVPRRGQGGRRADACPPRGDTEAKLSRCGRRLFTAAAVNRPTRRRSWTSPASSCAREPRSGAQEEHTERTRIPPSSDAPLALRRCSEITSARPPPGAFSAQARDP